MNGACWATLHAMSGRDLGPDAARAEALRAEDVLPPRRAARTWEELEATK